MLVDLDKLLEAYHRDVPDPAVPAQRVAFGTSGHRGSSFKRSFNSHHILAVVQAICEYRKRQGTTGPLFLGIDTHALSRPAFDTALEVLAANGVEVMIDQDDGYTPTPVISHAILTLQSRPGIRPQRRHRDYALAQSARGRRDQIQPAAGRTGRHAGHQVDRRAG